MKARGLSLLIFPIIGSVGALLFRPSEATLHLAHPSEDPLLQRRTLYLPDGEALRFIGVPDETDERTFYLAETELPDALWRQFSDLPPSYERAKAFCEWLSDLTGESLRLPTAEERRTAARAGLPNLEFPWGYAPPQPPRGVHFALDRHPRRPGRAFGYGFRDLAGGRWEWTKEGLALGGAWSERDPRTLAIDYEWRPPPGYADQDMTLRLVWERGS